MNPFLPGGVAPPEVASPHPRATLTSGRMLMMWRSGKQRSLRPFNPRNEGAYSREKLKRR
jgi:hypothetical protein